jgi:hypothetical protein
MSRKFVFAGVVLCFAVAAFGQEAGGGISGTVSDPAQAAVPGAKVAAIDVARGTTTATAITPSASRQKDSKRPAASRSRSTWDNNSASI